MEINGLMGMEEKLCDERIASFTSDGDDKIKKFIENLDRKVPSIITKDPSHVYLPILRTLKTPSSM